MPHVASEERAVDGLSGAKLMAEHKARYAFAARHAAGRRVLDVACGSGYGAAMLREAGAAEVIGVDCDAGALEWARRRYGGDGVNFLQGDACAPPVAGRFGLIVSFETIEHLERPEAFLAACAGLLARDGLFVVSTPYPRRPNADGTPRNPFHRQEWRTEEFAALLGRHFGEVVLYGQALRLSRGTLGLSPKWAAPLACLRGLALKDPCHIYALPGPRFFGLWRPLPSYVLAVCRS
jgi:2-polyprenyl-3-methyl-5-hydroxy-6-metoxy-1,4-benzoquinol methylase